MKKAMCVSIDKDLYHKLHVINAVADKFLKRDMTMSSIVCAALTEYFKNHEKEIDDMMRKYHDEGGCFEL